VIQKIDVVEIREGETRLLVPADHSLKGPGKRTGKVFFNNQMGFSRDITVSLFRAIDTKGWGVLDAMAGTGARGIRIANEAGGDFDIWINDVEKEANSFVEENIMANGLKRTFPLNQDLRCLLARKVFHYVDIDPFGSPVPFLQSSMNGCRRRGMLAATATDTAPLSGTYPKKCIRRYGARPCRSRFGHEVGLRILIGHAVKEAASLDRSVNPVLCFYADHYFRIHLSMMEGGGKADRCLESLGYLDYDPESGRREVTYHPGVTSIGPLWLGPLFDSKLLSKMRSENWLAHPRRVAKFLKICREELDVPYFYESDEVAHLLGGSPPSLESILERLKETGEASPTHFSPTGFKTNLPLDEILSSVEDMM